MLKQWILISTPILAILLAFTNCSDVNFQELQPNQSLSKEPIVDPDEALPEIPLCSDSSNNLGGCFALKDSFENRSDLLEEAFQWHSAVDDRGRNSHLVSMNILDDQTMGPTSDGSNALYFSGRPGSSVHYMYLISKEIDLSEFKSFKIQFDYLTIDLEQWSYRGKGGMEQLRLEICLEGEEKCNEKINDSIWETIYSSDDSGSELNGHNHAMDHWSRDKEFDFDLAAMGSSKVTLRFSVIIDEGFLDNQDGQPVFSSKMEDGVAIDNVRVIAYK